MILINFSLRNPIPEGFFFVYLYILMKQTDQELLLEISRGDANAFSEFYDRHSRLVYGALLRLLRDTDNAEDILQDVFVQVWRKSSTYQPALGSPKNWLVRIAHNRAINLIRSQRERIKKLEIPVPNEDSGVLNQELIDDSLLDNTVSAERMEMITSAFKDLAEDQVKLLEMAFFDGYSHSEISEALKMPLGTVKTRIRSALIALRQTLGFLREEFT
jgi:RNA polymerase sigma-70 factor (ECF subfamily)